METGADAYYVAGAALHNTKKKKEKGNKKIEQHMYVQMHVTVRMHHQIIQKEKKK